MPFIFKIIDEMSSYSSYVIAYGQILAVQIFQRVKIRTEQATIIKCTKSHSGIFTKMISPR